MEMPRPNNSRSEKLPKVEKEVFVNLKQRECQTLHSHKKYFIIDSFIVENIQVITLYLDSTALVKKSKRVSYHSLLHFPQEEAAAEV